MATGQFFAIDIRTWAEACQLGLNAAVAYLVLARGTDRKNRTTAWSVNAIETCTSISRSRAKASIQTLCDRPLVRKIKQGLHPRYELLSWAEVAGSGPSRKSMSAAQNSVYEMLTGGRQPQGSDTRFADDLVHRGWLKRNEHGHYQIVNEAPSKPEPDWIWLPNEIVTAASGEIAPLELLRQTQDVMILRLFVDLYYAQNLREDGGISRSVIHKSFEREKIGQQAQYIVWGFKEDSWETYPRNELISPHLDHSGGEDCDPLDPFWSRFALLRELGLVERVPYLFESDDVGAEPIHPYGIRKTNCLEDRLGLACHRAAVALITDEQRRWAGAKGYKIFAPVPQHLTNVRMSGVARLRYRPRTSLTAAWWAELQTKCAGFIRHYMNIADQGSSDCAGYG